MLLVILIGPLAGLIVGALAKLFIPSARSRSIGLNILLGVAGAMIAGFVGGFVGPVVGIYGTVSLVLPFLGAILAVFAMPARLLARTRRESASEPTSSTSIAESQSAEKIVARTAASGSPSSSDFTAPEIRVPQPLRSEAQETVVGHSNPMSVIPQQDISLEPVISRNRPHIFLSYATPDRSVAGTLAAALSRQGFNVWWDRTIPPGKSFDEVIEHALDSARCVVVLWTSSSASSNWVRAEAAEGLRRGVLVPVMMEDVRIPLEFRRIQAANLTDWQQSAEHPGFRSLLNSLVSVVGPS